MLCLLHVGFLTVTTSYVSVLCSPLNADPACPQPDMASLTARLPDETNLIQMKQSLALRSKASGYPETLFEASFGGETPMYMAENGMGSYDAHNFAVETDWGMWQSRPQCTSFECPAGWTLKPEYQQWPCDDTQCWSTFKRRCCDPGKNVVDKSLTRPVFLGDVCKNNLCPYGWTLKPKHKRQECASNATEECWESYKGRCCDPVPACSGYSCPEWAGYVLKPPSDRKPCEATQGKEDRCFVTYKERCCATPAEVMQALANKTTHKASDSPLAKEEKVAEDPVEVPSRAAPSQPEKEPPSNEGDGASLKKKKQKTVAGGSGICMSHVCPWGWVIKPSGSRKACTEAPCRWSFKKRCCEESYEKRETCIIFWDKYSCPEGWVPRAWPGEVPCMGAKCTKEDKMHCCLFDALGMSSWFATDDGTSEMLESQALLAV